MPSIGTGTPPLARPSSPLRFYSQEPTISRYIDTVKADGPALLWALDSTTGATDLSGNGRNGTGAGGITIGGFSGSPLVDGSTSTDFDGTNDFVSSAYAAFTGTRTLVGWAYRDNNSALHMIWGGTGALQPQLRIVSGSNDVALVMQGAVYTWTAAWPGTGQWVFWVVKATPSGNAELWINGVSQGTKAVGTWGTPGDLVIGSRLTGVNFFDGKMAGPAVFERALTTSEIQSYYRAGLDTGPRSILVRELPPTRLSVNVQPPSGRGYRWGADEPTPHNVPSDLTFSSTAPGGFESFSCTLPRKPESAYPDLERLSNVTVRGAGGQIAWEGRIEGVPRVAGQSMAVSPVIVGWQAHLEDDKNARQVYVDRDLNNWTSMSRARKLALIAAPFSPTDASVSSDPTSGIPAVITAFDGNASTTRQLAEALYDIGAGLVIGSIYYDYVRGTNVTSSYTASIFTDDDSSFPSATATTTLANSASSTGTHSAGTSERFAGVQLITPAGDGGTDGLVHDSTFRRLAVWGSHGLTKRGTAPDDGLYASDVVAHALANFAPLIAYSTGVDGSITPSSFVIPQLAFRDPTTAADIISTANRFHLRDWFIWEGSRAGQPTFYYHDRGARGKAWRARIGPSQLSETGPSMDRLFNGVVVRYSDVDGSTKTVGPTGSTADATSTDLIDTDPLNPANKLGIRRHQVLDMNGVSTLAGATEVGRRFLIETKQFDTSGQAQITGFIEDDRGIKRPAWQIRAGDTISFVDASDTSARRVVRATYSDSTKTCSVDLDAPPDGLGALLERLQVVLLPLGL